MKLVKYISLSLIALLISCTEVGELIEDVIVAIPSDSTQVDEQEKEETKQVSAESDNWKFFGESEFDKSKNVDDKEGALRLSKTGETWDDTDRIISNNKYLVEPGKTYKMVFKMITHDWPPPTIEVFGDFYDKSNSRLSKSIGSYFSNSKTNYWEKSLIIVDVPNDSRIKYFSPTLLMLPKKSIDADNWADDIEFSEYKFNNNFLPKTKFDGTKVKIDMLGNVSKKNNEKFDDFFPIGIYGDNQREDWSVYAKQGFNCYMWSSDLRQIEKAKDAGLLSCVQIGPYIIGGDWLPANKNRRIEHLTNFLNSIDNHNQHDQILFYYIDNEFYKIDQHVINVIQKVKNINVDDNGNRMHPIYMLNGAYGQARKYNELVDATGTYVVLDETDIPLSENFIGLQVNENQKIPAVMAQINRGVGKNFRPVLFGAIAKGAKGLGFWRDGGSGVDITKEPWWDDFPQMVKEIKEMMPLIKEPHFTDWTVNCDNRDLIYGTRTHKNKGHIILANPTKLEITASFIIEGLPYQISSVNDYFTKGKISKPNGNEMTLSINAHGSKVLILN